MPEGGDIADDKFYAAATRNKDGGRTSVGDAAAAAASAAAADVDCASRNSLRCTSVVRSLTSL